MYIIVISNKEENVKLFHHVDTLQLFCPSEARQAVMCIYIYFKFCFFDRNPNSHHYCFQKFIQQGKYLLHYFSTIVQHFIVSLACYPHDHTRFQIKLEVTQTYPEDTFCIPAACKNSALPCLLFTLSEKNPLQLLHSLILNSNVLYQTIIPQSQHEK